ncbi:hypothetical protein Tco_0983837 [Tanacetum coccineum]
MVNSIDKHGKKCLMLSAKATWVIDDKNSAFESSQETRNTYEDYYTCYVNVKDVALAHILVYEWCESEFSFSWHVFPSDMSPGNSIPMDMSSGIEVDLVFRNNGERTKKKKVFWIVREIEEKEGALDRRYTRM